MPRSSRGQELPVSIRCGWPDLITKGRKGKSRGSRSKLLGNRELEARVIVKPSKRLSNGIEKARKDLADKRAKRNRLTFIINNPEAKAGAIRDNGTILPRVKGKFQSPIKVA